MEVRGLKAKRRMHFFFHEGPEDNGGQELAEVALVVLYGFLDAEQHGGEPLVQP